MGLGSRGQEVGSGELGEWSGVGSGSGGQGFKRFCFWSRSATGSSMVTLSLSLSRFPSFTLSLGHSPSPFLHAKVREVLSDCALPISVLLFSFIGSYLFSDIDRECPSSPQRTHT